MVKANQNIRKKIEENHIRYWQVAYAYGIDDVAFSKKLRRELPKEEKEKINKIIDNLIKEKEESKQNVDINVKILQYKS